MSDLRRYFGEKWDRDGGEERLLLTHDLNENSVVFDVGGYTGEWARAIVDKYDPHIFIFEPVPEFCEVLSRKFKHNRKARVMEYGLASADAFLPMAIRGSASCKADSIGGTTCRFRSTYEAAIDVMQVHHADDVAVDLMAINIEGGEYDLLPSMMDGGFIRRCKEIVIQFHMVWPDCYDRWKAIRERLNVTHGEVWGYPFVWEKWVRR